MHARELRVAPGGGAVRGDGPPACRSWVSDRPAARRHDARPARPPARMCVRTFGLLCGFLAVSATGAADWPQFLGPLRNGVSAETGLLQSWDEQGPPLVWEKQVGEGHSGPVVAGGR